MVPMMWTSAARSQPPDARKYAAIVCQTYAFLMGSCQSIVPCTIQADLAIVLVELVLEEVLRRIQPLSSYGQHQLPRQWPVHRVSSQC